MDVETANTRYDYFKNESTPHVPSLVEEKFGSAIEELQNSRYQYAIAKRQQLIYSRSLSALPTSNFSDIFGGQLTAVQNKPDSNISQLEKDEHGIDKFGPDHFKYAPGKNESKLNGPNVDFSASFPVYTQLQQSNSLSDNVQAIEKKHFQEKQRPESAFL
jgi:hypothetical protein